MPWSTRGLHPTRSPRRIPASSERDPGVRHLHRRFRAERRVILVELLRGAVKSGELPPDTDRNVTERSGISEEWAAHDMAAFASHLGAFSLPWAG